MSFNINNTTVSESVIQSSIENKSIISYTPTWVYNSDNALSRGTMSTEDGTGYKIINIIDANGINIKYWINTINLLYTTKSSNVIYTTFVDTNNGTCLVGLNNLITDNENGTYTIIGGDAYTSGDLFVDNNTCYSSYYTK